MEDPSGTVVSVQQGVFRSNCIDCLDRTNVVQSMLAQRSLVAQFQVCDFFYSTALRNEGLFTWLLLCITTYVCVAYGTTCLSLMQHVGIMKSGESVNDKKEFNNIFKNGKPFPYA